MNHKSRKRWPRRCKSGCFVASCCPSSFAQSHSAPMSQSCISVAQMQSGIPMKEIAKE